MDSTSALLDRNGAGPPPFRRRIWVAWVAQVLLAVGFGIAGYMKVAIPIDRLSTMMMGWVRDVPPGLVKLIRVAELAGAIGQILPAATKVFAHLTVLSAWGFVVIQILAIAFHFTRGELFTSWPYNAALLALSSFVIWARSSGGPTKT